MTRILIAGAAAMSAGIVASLKNANMEAVAYLTPCGVQDPFEPETRHRKRGQGLSPAQRLMQKQRKKRQTK